MNELTVKEFAQVERVDERTVRRWIAKGAVEVRRTAGGGIRVVDRRAAAVFFSLGRSAAFQDNSGHPAT